MENDELLPLAEINRRFADSMTSAGRNAPQEANEADREISRLRKENERLKHLAAHDPLTGLWNRSGFREISNGTIEALRRTKANVVLMIVVIDINKFKLINDYYGHSAGDMAIKAVGDALHLKLRRSTLTARIDVEDPSLLENKAARYGGDEFVLLLPIHEGDDPEIVVLKVTQRVEEQANENVDRFFRSKGLAISFSYGFALYDALAEPDRSLPPETVMAGLIRAADEEMYKMKLLLR